MDSEALVELALQTLSCSQKELAVRLRVSPTQISKWKKGEHMSFDMADKIRGLLNIGTKAPSFVLWAGSLEAASKWESVIQELAAMANDGAETGYDTPPLTDDIDLLCALTVDTLREMGVDSPKAFPDELNGLNLGSEVEYEEVEDAEVGDDTWDLLDANPYTSLIYKIYKSYTDVYGFYAAYVVDLVQDEELDLWDPVGSDIDGCLLSLAASKLDVEDVQDLVTNFREFKASVTNEYDEWLNVVKERAFRAGAPLRAELLDMVRGSHDEIGHEAERESLGFNSSRLHPDIYMNELLCGMRLIRQVLPAILEKLDIKDFKVDESDFYAK